MKAMILQKYHNSNNFDYVEDYPKPTIAPNQVLIQVKAASVNPLDWKTAHGELRFVRRVKLPLILGNDVAGTIVQVGKKVKNFSVGDDVFCMLDGNKKAKIAGFAKSGGYAI
jgi:alcohol dehydrogenase